MATINWTNGNGVDDWFTAGNWSGSTVPGAGDTAVIRGSGHYEVHVDAAVTVGEIDFGYKNAFFIESASGSITAHKFETLGGFAELGAANTFANVTIDGGEVLLSDDHSLGTKAIHTDAGIIATADDTNINLHNKIDIRNGGGFAAQTGTVLTMSGALDIAPTVANWQFAITFGGAASNRWIQTTGGGTVNITSTSFDVRGEPTAMETIAVGGTVRSGQGAHSVGANGLFSHASQVYLATGTSVLDVRNFGTDVTLNAFGGVGTLIGNSAVTVHLHNPAYDGVLKGVTAVLDGTGHVAGDLGHSHFTMAAGTNTIDFSAAVSGLFTLAAPDGSTSTITVGGQTSEHITDFQDGNLTIDTTTANTAHYNLEIESGDVRLVVHPGGGANVYSMFFDGLTSTDGITVGDDGHGHLKVTWTDPAGATAHSAHDIDVANQVAQALLVPASHDVF